MAKPSAHPGFKILLKEWNRRLAETGFQDIETEFLSEPVLKQSGTEKRYKRMDPVRREAKHQFFKILEEKVKRTRLKCQMVFTFVSGPKGQFFESEQELNILSLYSQGVSQAQIKRRLSIEGHRCQIYYPIYKWLKLWGLK
jgi:hypothetical protein